MVVGCWLLVVCCLLFVVVVVVVAVAVVVFVFCCCCCWLLVVGCWLLAVGCWLLAVGCWLLAVGCWLLFLLLLLLLLLFFRGSMAADRIRIMYLSTMPRLAARFPGLQQRKSIVAFKIEYEYVGFFPMQKWCDRVFQPNGFPETG